MPILPQELPRGALRIKCLGKELVPGFSAAAVPD
jgi:hypothetical protein